MFKVSYCSVYLTSTFITSPLPDKFEDFVEQLVRRKVEVVDPHAFHAQRKQQFAARADVQLAELSGLRACLRRAVSSPRPRIVFEGDSMLCVMMMTGKWGCHREHLRELLEDCFQLGEQLSSAGTDWWIRHILREYNTCADDLAGRAIRDPLSVGPSPAW